MTIASNVVNKVTAFGMKDAFGAERNFCQALTNRNFGVQFRVGLVGQFSVVCSRF